MPGPSSISTNNSHFIFITRVVLHEAFKRINCITSKFIEFGWALQPAVVNKIINLGPQSSDN